MSDEIIPEVTPEAVTTAPEPTPEAKVPEPGETLLTPVKDPQEPVQKTKDISDDKVGDGAPETYETFTMPEGVEMDKAAMESFLPVAKTLNLSQVEAQALVDYEAQRVAEFATSQEDDWKKLQTEWRTA
ncbi:hypothetical protein LCGC14_2555760, partial [marine sediment metagenome]